MKIYHVNKEKDHVSCKVIAKTNAEAVDLFSKRFSIAKTKTVCIYKHGVYFCSGRYF